MMMSAQRSAMSNNGKRAPQDIAIRIETTTQALNDRKTPLVRLHPPVVPSADHERPFLTCRVFDRLPRTVMICRNYLQRKFELYIDIA